MGRSCIRSLVAVPILAAGSLTLIEAGGVGPAGASGNAPSVVAFATCYQSSSVQSGVSFSVRIMVDAYNLPPSADGTTLSGSTGPASTPNTTFYAYPDGSSPTGAAAVPMGIANGAGWGETGVSDAGGPYGYSVLVLYRVPGGMLAGAANMLGPVHVTVPDPSQCGSANVTSASSAPGTVSGDIVGTASTADGAGYWMVSSDGRVYSYGDASNLYDQYIGTDFLVLNKPIVGMAATPDGRGYWLVAADGGVFSYGDAGFYGSMGGTPLDKPIVGMAATPDGRGYWLVASDGGVFAYGDAEFSGSMGGTPLDQPVVGMAVDGATGGYWLVAGDGGVFSFDAPFLGSTGGKDLGGLPVVAMAAAPDGSGYRFVTSNGGVFCFGLAFAGSTAGVALDEPITSMAPAGGGGYWLVAADGGVFSYGAGFYGSPA